MYKYENGNDMFDSFIDTFKKIVEKQALIQTKKAGVFYLKKAGEF